MGTRDGSTSMRSLATCGLLVAGALGVGTLFVGTLAVGCTSLPGVEPRIEEVRSTVTHVDAAGVDMRFEVDVLNPYLSSLHAPFLSYALEVSERTLAAERRAAGAEFPATGVGTISIPVRVTYAELAAAHGSLEGVSDVPCRLTGGFRVPFFGSAVDLDFEHETDIPIVRAPEIRVLAVTFEERAESTVTIDAEIVNPNGFVVDISDQRGELVVAKAPVALVRVAAPQSVPPGATLVVRFVGEATPGRAAARRIGTSATPAATLRLIDDLDTPWGPLPVDR